MLDYIIKPRHSDLIVDAVNILAPQPRILDISLESSDVAPPYCTWGQKKYPKKGYMAGSK